VQAERCARFHRQTVGALGEIVAAAGLDHPRDLRSHHLMQRVGSTELKPIDRIYPFLAEGALIDAPGETHLAAAWEAADPASFRPVTDPGKRSGRLAEPRKS